MNLEDILHRIDQRLAALGMSATSASKAATGHGDAIRNMQRAARDKAGAGVSTRTLAALAPVLKTSVTWLMEGTGAEAVEPPTTRAPEVEIAPVPVPSSGSLPKDVPVWGTAMGSLVDGVEGVHLYSGEPVEYVRRPPGLMTVRDAYAFYVSGDSMHPMHPHGVLRFAHPHRPASPGDSVVVVTRHWDSDPGQGYIKILRRRTGEHLILEQLNPPATIHIPLKHVVSVHKVPELAELFGV